MHLLDTYNTSSTPTILPSIEERQFPHPIPNLRPVTIHFPVSSNPILCAGPGVYVPALPEKTYSGQIPNSSTPYQQPITPSCGSDLVPTFTHFSGIRPQTLHLLRASLFHLLLSLAFPQYGFSYPTMVPKPFVENDGTPIRNIQPLPHRLIISNLPAISGDISKQTAEATLEDLLSTAGIGPNDQPVFFESHKIGYPTGLSDPPQSRYKALHTDYFEIVGPENDIRFTTKIHDFLNANPYREWRKVPPQFNPQVHLLMAQFLKKAGPSTFDSPLLDEDGNVWPRLFAHFTDTKENDVRAPEDLLCKAVKAHIDKHFEDMLDVPAESCISITTESNARHDQCKVLVTVRLAGSTMVDKITASKARSTFSTRLNIPIRSMSRLAPQANNKMEPLLVEHTITGVFKRGCKSRTRSWSYGQNPTATPKVSRPTQ
ncbi:BQ5605_C017g08418 [Microbotryum silenes-dioicae]|uniref:BQ5605_C017g08418 protein n=1 Tax=Microbotryum silenes-dioicae TaxID=796604 RepID=A0A2X0NSB7_9BASI|nr:BQ5605_C017g08418 [Microbotryum silenes-dioicae]